LPICFCYCFFLFSAVDDVDVRKLSQFSFSIIFFHSARALFVSLQIFFSFFAHFIFLFQLALFNFLISKGGLFCFFLFFFVFFSRSSFSRNFLHSLSETDFVYMEINGLEMTNTCETTIIWAVDERFATTP
jgi:hypothetical protein